MVLKFVLYFENGVEFPTRKIKANKHGLHYSEFHIILYCHALLLFSTILHLLHLQMDHSESVWKNHYIEDEIYFIQSHLLSKPKKNMNVVKKYPRRNETILRRCVLITKKNKENCESLFLVKW